VPPKRAQTAPTINTTPYQAIPPLSSVIGVPLGSSPPGTTGTTGNINSYTTMESQLVFNSAILVATSALDTKLGVLYKSNTSVVWSTNVHTTLPSCNISHSSAALMEEVPATAKSYTIVPA